MRARQIGVYLAVVHVSLDYPELLLIFFREISMRAEMLITNTTVANTKAPAQAMVCQEWYGLAAN